MSVSLDADPKKYAWTAALLLPCLPFMAFLWWRNTGGAVWAWWTPVLIVFGGIPAVEILLGDDQANPPEELRRYLQQASYYRWLTYLYIPLQYAALVLCCAVWERGELGIADRIGLILSLGIVNGISINTAHELGHRRGMAERWLSKIALAPAVYGHFYVEHNRGHHVRVATAEDPASARLGESFWAFWPRTVLGGLRSAWQLETKRFRVRQCSRWTWRNDILNAWAISLALWGVLVAAFGLVLLPFLLLQAVVGFSLLEVVNYIEHYGLRRQRTSSGRYEKVDHRHSWNSDQIVSNIFLFQLARHSDHHVNPQLRYQTLRAFEKSPQLPAGYATMIVLALISPLWRRIMDPKVVAHYGGDLSLANVHPAAVARLRRHYPTLR